MREELSLREIIETIFKWKITIVAITIVAILLGAVYSLFLVSSTYQARSIVRVVAPIEDASTKSISIDEYIESLRSDVTLNRILNKLELDKNQYTIGSLRDSISLGLVKDTKVVKINVAGKDPNTITRISNIVAFELGASIEISDRADQIVKLKNKIIDLESSITLRSRELEEIQSQLKNTPEKLETKKSLVEDLYLQSIVKDNVNDNSANLGRLELTNEEINPLFTNLKAKASEATILLINLEEQKKIYENMITSDEERINELERQFVKDQISEEQSERLLNGFNAVFISTAIEPTEPIGSSKILIIVISAVIGIMFSIMYVLLRNYWITTNREILKKSNNMNIDS